MRPASILLVIVAACLDPNAVTSTPAVTYTISLGQPSFALTVGQSVFVTATVLPSDGHSAPKQELTWSTADSTVAKFTATRVFTALSPGTTTLRASLGTTVATAPVTVTAPQATITFVATGSMSVARVRHTATLLRDGTVLIAGGSSDRPLSAELDDPVSRNFMPTGNMTTARAAHTATLLPDGRVLIVGGDLVPTGQDRPLQTTAELYDPVTKTFARTGDVVTPQMAHTATLLDNGKVLIAGGLTTGCCPSSAVRAEIYDPSTGKFTETGAYAGSGTQSAISGGPALPTATLLRNGTVLLAGEPTAERYDPNTGTFSLTGAMLTQRAFGGRPTYIAGRTATRLSDGMVLLTGGEHEDLGRFSSAELYDPATGLFTLTGDMASVRDAHSASLLPNGSVLIAGGETIGPGCPSCAIFSLASAELYDPNRRTFTSAGNMNVRRELHTATVLNDGTVLIVGGLTFDGGPISSGFTATPLASGELFGVSSQRSPPQ